MYEFFMHTLRRLFGSGLLRLSMTVAVGLLVLGLVMWSSGAFRQWCRAAQQRTDWRAVALSVGRGLFKLLLVFVLARVLIVALDYRAVLFEHECGRITDRNRDAVLMKWGGPNEQRELSVSFTEKRTWVSRTIKLPGEKGQVIQQEYWKEEEPQLLPVDGQLPSVVSRREQERNETVHQRGVEQADIDILVRDNPRQLGNANYAGYDDQWRLKYVIVNRHSRPVTATVAYVFPSPYCDKVKVLVDGKDVTDQVAADNDESTWSIAMDAGARSTIEVSYESRGLEHLRFIPQRRVLTPHYRVSIRVQGIPARRLDFPIGSMPSLEKLSDIDGDDYTLTWNLDNAMTSLDIGVKLPVAEQPGYLYRRLLAAAPVGLLLLLLLLAGPRLIAGEAFGLPVVALVLVAYVLFNTLLVSLAGLNIDFARALAIAAGVLLACTALFRLLDRSDVRAAVRDALWFAFVAIGYSLISICDSERAALYMQIVWIGLLVYMAALVTRHHVLPAAGRKGA